MVGGGFFFYVKVVNIFDLKSTLRNPSDTEHAKQLKENIIWPQSVLTILDFLMTNFDKFFGKNRVS